MSAQGRVSLYIDNGEKVVNVGASADTGIAYLTTKAFDFGVVEASKYLQRIVTHVRDLAQNLTLKVEVYGSDDEEEEFELLDTLVVSDPDSQWTDPPGFKYYKLRIVDETVTTRWAIHGLILWGEIGGEEF